MDFVRDGNILPSPYGHDAVIAVSMTLLLGFLFSLSLHCYQLPLKRQVVREGYNRANLLQRMLFSVQGY